MIDLRRRTEEGDDLVLKLTPGHARIGLAHGKARLAIRTPLPADALLPVYATLREQACDRVQTAEVPPSSAAPSSRLGIRAGRLGYVVEALGRTQPTAEWADAYAACVEAIQGLLPSEHADVVVHLQWSDAMASHPGTLDVQADAGLVGVHRIRGPQLHVALHFDQPTSIEALLVHGAPSRSEHHTLEVETATADGAPQGWLVDYDAARERAVLRPLPVEPAADAPATTDVPPEPSAAADASP